MQCALCGKYLPTQTQNWLQWKPWAPEPDHPDLGVVRVELWYRRSVAEGRVGHKWSVE